MFCEEAGDAVKLLVIVWEEDVDFVKHACEGLKLLCISMA